jgi:hypothetical protein
VVNLSSPTNALLVQTTTTGTITKAASKPSGTKLSSGAAAGISLLSDANQQQKTAAVDAVFATLMSGDAL